MSAGNAPAETPGVAQPLRFRQVGLASLQLLFLQFQGLSGESPIHRGRQQRQAEDDKGDAGNSGSAKCGDAYSVRQVHRHARVCETGGRHAGVVHDRDRDTHHDGSGQLFRADPRFLIPEVKRNPKRGERNQNGEHDGQHDEKGIEMAYRR